MKNFKFYSSFLIVAVIFCFSSCSSTSAPGDTVIKAYDLMMNNQAEKAVALYVSGEGKKLSDDESKKMEGLVGMANDQWNKKDGLKNVEITEEKIDEDGNTAKVNFVVNYKNGDSEKDDADLIKIDGKWFIKLN